MREISCVKAGDTAHAETCRIPNVVEAAAGTFKVPPLVALVVRDILERMMELEDRFSQRAVFMICGGLWISGFRDR